MILMDLKGRIQFFKTEALPSALRRSVPKSFDMVIGHIVYFIAVGVKDDQERHAALLFKLSHKADLVLMDILQAKRIAIAFLGVKAHRNALNRSDVIHRTLLVKISQCDMPVLFINFDGRDRRLVRLMRSSRVEPRRPLEFQVAILLSDCGFYLLYIYRNFPFSCFISTHSSQDAAKLLRQFSHKGAV